MVVKLLNEYSSLSYKLNESSEKETKERMDMFMVEKSEKKSIVDLVFTRKGKKT